VFLTVLLVPSCALIAGLEEKEFTPAAAAGSAGRGGSPGASSGAAGSRQGGETGHAGAGLADGAGGSSAGRGEEPAGGTPGSSGAADDGGAPAGGAGTPAEAGGSGTAGSAGSGGVAGRPPSCATEAIGTGTNCGPGGDEDCCESRLVEGGTFELFNDSNYPAEVSSFRLDRFEVTVGRFRAFVRALEQGWRPEPESGLHAHLDGGRAPGEIGWQAAWDEFLSESVESCPNDNYSDEPGETDREPIVCASYYHAFAFCVWDRGYLPSAREFLYVVTSGIEGRPYPWGTELEPSRAVYGAPGLAVVGSKPDGEGVWGHRDLIGNAWEMVADNDHFPTDCIRDCAYFEDAWHAFAFGGSFESSATSIADWTRLDLHERAGNDETGFRCGRAP
jgi:formylglycine-generating enzyme required for sulfatase activity